MEKKKVDIIIPVYNAYEELAACLESVYRYTDLAENRLILVNDNSTDGRILPYLEDQRRENVIVLHNENNQGFSRNINIGMAQSELNDVVLLNSDTVVTEHWIEKMLECAYSQVSIGTVTPLSNNATLCSVPKFCKENELPEQMTVAQAGRIVERCSMKKYPRITTAHGFCMLIKREVINTIGNFDAETFERGYGEENDFCSRAEQAGYHHVMCDNTYIYHRGTKSFLSKEKEKYMMLHDRILRERYPYQMHGNDIHVRDNPNGFVGENIGIYFELANGKKNILYVVQSDFRNDASDNIGGTQLHVRDLVSGLRETYNLFVAARDGVYLNLTVYYGAQEIVFRYYIGEKKQIYEFYNEVFDSLWRNILSAFCIDLIHVHHVMNASFDIFYVADEYHIPVIFTAHDYFFVCPTVKLLDFEYKICVEKDTSERCRVCLNKQLGITDQIDYRKIWRERCIGALQICKRVLAPDQNTAERLAWYYPFLANKINVIVHGYDRDGKVEPEVISSIEAVCQIEKVCKEGFSYRVSGWAYLRLEQERAGEAVYLQIRNKSGAEAFVPTARHNRPDVMGNVRKCKAGFVCLVPQRLLDGGPLEIKVVLEDRGKLIYGLETFETPRLAVTEKKLNIAFIGGLNRAKGGEEASVIIDAVKENVNWHVFGGIGVKRLQQQKQSNLIKTGEYLPKDLPVLLKEHEIDVVGILSIWPETYSYTLTEAVSNGVPVIAIDIGALGRRMKELDCGWVVSREHVKEEFLTIVQTLIHDRSQLIEYKETAAKLELPDAAQMAKQYQNLYEEFWNSHIEYGTADFETIYAGYTWGQARGAGMPEQSLDSKQRFSEMKAELESIRSSISYRIVRKIWSMKIPGKKAAKKIAGWINKR